MPNTMPMKKLSDANQSVEMEAGMSHYKDMLILPSYLVDDIEAPTSAENANVATADAAEDARPKEFDKFVIERTVEPTAVAKLDPNWLYSKEELQALAAHARPRWGIRQPTGECFPTMRVYREEAIDSALKTLGSKITDSDEKKTNQSRLDLMKEAGGIRRVAQFDAHVSLRALDVLDKDFPNFAEVTAYLRGEFALGRADDCTVRPSPILLDGPPGCGKTEYARRISTLFGLPPEHFHIVNVATLQTSATLCGSSSHYANTKTGLIFDEIVFSRYANPVILLDEVEKCRGDERFSPAAVLYGLLSDSAKHFSDEAVHTVPIDASRINWILTSNYADTIEPALLSRLMRFNIEMPTPEESRAIVGNIYKGMQAIIKGMQTLTLSEGAIGDLIVLSPRKIRETLKLAAGQALLDGRIVIESKDVPVFKTKASIGF